MRSLSFEAYHDAIAKTAIYPGHGTGNLQAIQYVALGAAEEAGEIAGKLKKYMRGDYGIYEFIKRVKKEIGDNLWYLDQLASEIGYFDQLASEIGTSLADIAEENVAKVLDRQRRDVQHGDGDDR